MMVGGALTVTVKLVVAVNPPPSFTVRVIVAVPLWPAAGRTLSVRDAPLPPNISLIAGNSVGLLDLHATDSKSTAVRSSPTVKGSVGVN